jgi:eukaryotic-like serine/threonine-protein kinase
VTRQPPSSSIPPSAHHSDLGARLRQKIVETRSEGFSVASVTTIASGTVLAGRYRVVRHIGRGAFCDVFEARDLADDELPCAVKVPRPERESNANREARFRLEAHAASLLESPHTAKARDFGVLEDGRPFYVMEFLKGLSLARLLARDVHVHEAHVAMIGIDVLHALVEAHGRGIIHRDIKPSNVLLVQNPKAPRVYARLIDFGIAKRMPGALGDGESLDLTGAGRSPCTPRFAAPEQLRSITDARTDIYALGLLLSTLLEGVSPYSTFSGATLVAAQLSEERVPWGPRTRASALYPVIAQACAKRTDWRFANASAMRQALRSTRSSLIASGSNAPALDLSAQDCDFEGADTTDLADVSAL